VDGRRRSPNRPLRTFHSRSVPRGGYTRQNNRRRANPPYSRSGIKNRISGGLLQTHQITMRTEENNSGYVRVWLDEQDKQQLLDYYADDPIKQVAMRLMMSGGLRSEEVPRVTANDLQQADGGNFQRLKIRTAKRGRRETVVPDSLAQQLRTVSNIREGGEVVDVTPRTIRNWVYEAAEHLRGETGEPDWDEVSAHDLRRTWATNLVQSGVPESNVMSWGGWKDFGTFRDHYFSESDEQIEKQLAGVSGF